MGQLIYFSFVICLSFAVSTLAQVKSKTVSNKDDYSSNQFESWGGSSKTSSGSSSSYKKSSYSSNSDFDAENFDEELKNAFIQPVKNARKPDFGKNCPKPSPPMNSKMECISTARKTVCTATCYDEYQFPDQSRVLKHECDNSNGKWTPEKSFPDCGAICNSPCQNGGRCMGTNQCICTPDFRGELCEFPISNCNGDNLNFNGGWSCNHTATSTVCTVRCPNGMEFESSPSSIYKCSLKGKWSPAEVPKCVPLGLNDYNPVKATSGIKTFAIKSKTVTSSNGVCNTWGQFHYRTFDGLTYSFAGECSYLLVRDCFTNTFNVHIVNDRSCSSTEACQRSIKIFLSNEEFFITNTKKGPSAFLGPNEISIPSNWHGVLIEKVAGHIIVRSSLGFKLSWDGKEIITVQVNSELRNMTCGLCGTYDDDTTNDFQTSYGTVVQTVASFANSWQMPDINGAKCQVEANQVPGCKYDTPSDIKMADDAQQICSELNSKQYLACQYLINPKPYIETCIMDYCACKAKNTANCVCNSFSAYFRECSRLGGQLKNGWRKYDRCPLTCKNGMIYKECGSSCPKTCKSATYSCTDEQCIEGCHCPEGEVLHDNQCIREAECPCIYQKKEYPTGSRIKKDCNACECKDKTWECTNQKCEARCSVIKGQHYWTFDGLHYNFMGKCSYYLIFNKAYSVELDNEHCDSDSSGCSQRLTIKMKNTIVYLKQGKEIVVNGIDILKLPHHSPGVYISMPSSLFIQVVLANGLRILTDSESRIYIDAPPSFIDQTMGLCGTFNYNQNDDYKTLEGDIETEIVPFGNRWKVSPLCPDVAMLTGDKDPCELFSQRKEHSKEKCGVLKSITFEECHNVVDVNNYYDDCLYEMCSCKGQEESCLCSSITGYAVACSRQGVTVNWKSAVPKCGFSCTGGQIYSECGTGCGKTCRDLSPQAVCTSVCIQGCQCPEGMALNDNDECIPIDTCPCYQNGKEYLHGQSDIRGKQICTCFRGQWQCGSSSNEKYTDISVLTTSDQCDANSEYTDCISECPTTCNNMHFPPQCTTVTCTAGCTCKENFVLDPPSGKCIKPKDCPCHHAGRSYEEGQTIRLDCNTCFCKSGSWNCEDKECAGICSVYGESHFKSFDNRMFDFQGSCEYVLVRGKNINTESLTVTVETVPCGTTGVTCSRVINVAIGPNGPDQRRLSLDRNKPIPPSSPGFLIYQSGMYVYVYTDVGLSLWWDRATKVYVRLNPDWKNKVIGLCGNFNEDQTDDFMSPSGGPSIIQPNDFGDSWRVQEFCPYSKVINDTCDLLPYRKAWAQRRCSILQSQTFAPCHSEVPHKPYLDRCVFDACGCDTGGDCECLCTAIAAYAQECNVHGVPIKWRTQELCPIQCEECEKYTPCMSVCPKLTCTNKDIFDELQQKCSDVCVEGCEPVSCAPGQIYKSEKEMKCIPEAECKIPCITINGITYMENERIRDPQITNKCQTCFCQKGEVKCIGTPCEKTTMSIIIPPTPKTTMEIPMLEPTCLTTGWTIWMNSDTPTWKSGGDFETYKKLRRQYTFCPEDQIKRVNCRIATSPEAKITQDIVCDAHQGLICFNSEQAKGAVCKDYEIQFYCDCNQPIPPTGGTLPPGPPIPPPTNAPRCITNGWTPWMNSMKANEEGDWETIPSLRKKFTFCADHEIELINCRVADTKQNYNDSGDINVECATDYGFICYITPHRGDLQMSYCKDYEVRFFCRCEAETTTESTVIPTSMYSTSTFIPTITPPTITLPPVCEDGWTSWMNIDDSTSRGSFEEKPGDGDYELLDHLRFYYSFCEQPVDIECRVYNSRVLAQDAGENVVCDPGFGLQCINEQQNRGICNDYEVRFYCACFTTRETTPYVSPVTNQTTKIILPTTTTYIPFITTQTTVPTTVFTYMTTETTKTTVSTTTTPISRVFVPLPPKCIKNGWTEWMNAHDPLFDGNDFENFENLRFDNQFCALSNVTSIECRKVDDQVPATLAGQNGITCDFSRGLFCSKDDQSPGQKCYDYEVRVFCICEEKTTPQPIPLTTPSTPQPLVPVRHCDEWTDWINTKKHATGGDFELWRTIANFHDICPIPTSVQCRDVITQQPFFKMKQLVICNKDGLICINKNQVCRDYEIRVFCQCEKPSSTPVPMTVSTPKYTGPCGWTEFFNIDSPVSGDGDIEDITTIRQQYEFCPEEMIESIECVVNNTQLPYENSGDFGVKCSKHRGVICYNDQQANNGQCQDYAVRFYCQCPPETTTTPPITQTTVATTILPLTAGPPKHICGWSMWMSHDNPILTREDIGEFETISDLNITYGLCAEESLLDIECRVVDSHIPWKEAKQKDISCDIHNGLTCYNNVQNDRCYDYEVRFYCWDEMCQVTTEATTPATTSRCPEDQIWEKCAYSCSQMCMQMNDQYTKSEQCQEGCVEGCRPDIDCNYPDLWRNEFSCVPPSECTCVFPDGSIAAPGEVWVSRNNCEECRCWNNTISCSTRRNCLTTPLPESLRICKDGPTLYFNYHSPNDEEEYELISDIEERQTYAICGEGKIVDIDCRDAKNKIPWHLTGQKDLECNINDGFYCNSKIQKNGICYDYEVRFSCICPATTTIKPTPLTSTVITQIFYCVNGWTRYVNTHIPDREGEYEHIYDVIQAAEACDHNMITSVECRKTGSKQVWNKLIDPNIKCDIQHGLQCDNRKQPKERACDDYEIRFYCHCPSSTTYKPTRISTVTTQRVTEKYTTPVIAAACVEGWTDYFNSNQPTDTEEIESLDIIREHYNFCADENIVDIECRDVESKKSFTVLQPSVSCSHHAGLYCDSTLLSDGESCLDYEVRFYCHCPITTERIPGVKTTSPSPEITSLKPTSTLIPIYECVDGWTQYFNGQTPNNAGEYELLEDLKDKFRFCSPNMITNIECREVTSKKSWVSIGQEGVICDNEIGFLCDNNDQPKGKSCHDYEVRFYCQCASTIPTKAATSIPTTLSTTMPSTISTIPSVYCVDGWTQYFNTHSPDETGEYEDRNEIREMYSFCADEMITDIECRDIESKMSWSSIQPEGVRCSLEEDLTCLPELLPQRESCLNYEVRFYCHCPKTTTPITTYKTITPTMTPMTSTLTPIYECVDGWTQYFNGQTPNNAGEYELIEDLKDKFRFCSPNMIANIECRGVTSKKSWVSIGQEGVICDNEIGFLCDNNDQPKGKSCHDYEVRFYCQCASTLPTKAPTSIPTTFSTATPSTTSTIPSAYCVNGWTQYFNTHSPDETGEYEDRNEIREMYSFCSDEMITDIECRDIESKMSWSSIQPEGVRCSLEEDLTCLPELLPQRESCLDYEIRFYCHCPKTTVPITTYKTITPTFKPMTSTVTPVTECIDGWTEFLNGHFPDEYGEFENLYELQSLYYFCDINKITDIQCRDSHTKKSWNGIGESDTICDIDNGFICKNDNQPKGRKCIDMEVRVYCQCLPITPKPSILPTTIKRTEAYCTDGWTEFFNPNKPNENGEFEYIESLRKYSTFCDSTMIIDIECRHSLTKQSWNELDMNLQDLVCDKEIGFVCKNYIQSSEYDCPDFEIRLKCQCPSSTTKPMTTPAIPPMLCVDGWTEYFNMHHPDDVGELETISNLRGRYSFCHKNMIENIECRNAVTKKMWSKTSSNSICSISEGFFCQNSLQANGNTCPDHEIRFYCHCRPSTIVVRPTTAPYCVHGWTQYFNENTPNENGEYESVDDLNNLYSFCENEMIVHAECIEAKTKKNWKDLNLRGAVCNTEDGFQCDNSIQSTGKKCPDISIRFFCQCYTTVSIPFTSPSTVAIPITTHISTPQICVNGWTEYFNNHRPNTDGEFERLEDLRQRYRFCSNEMIVDVECRDALSKNKFEDVGEIEGISCSLEEGYFCDNDFQPKGHRCRDFEIRFYCSCASTTIEYWTTTPLLPTQIAKCIEFEDIVNILPKDQFVASSSQHYHEASHVRNMMGDSWVAGVQDNYQWLEIDLLSDQPIYGIKTKGRRDPLKSEWVTSYQVQYSADKIEWQTYTDNYGNVKTFSGNDDGESESTNMFPYPIIAHYVRIRPQTWENAIAMQIELLGCAAPLTQLTSSTISKFYTTTSKPVPPKVVILCPEITDAQNCPDQCPEDLFCNGFQCVEQLDCPCIVENKNIKPGELYEKKNCDICSCFAGHLNCKPKNCPSCPQHTTFILTDDCKCECQKCPPGQRICPTNQKCIYEQQWCNGFEDCPDDEINCETTTPYYTPPPLTTVPPLIPPGIEVCELIGDEFNTFDETQYKYVICDHILFQDSKVQNPRFRVKIQQECSPKNSKKCPRSLEIKMYGNTIYLGSDKYIEVNGQSFTESQLKFLSRRLKDIHIWIVGEEILVKSIPDKFTVHWSTDYTVKIEASTILMDSVNGMCGNFNNISIDDFQTPQGSLVKDVLDFGASWKGDGGPCLIEECPPEDQAVAIETCGLLKSPSSVFSHCKNFIPQDFLVSACEGIMCDCILKEKDPEKCKCDALQIYAQKCEQETGKAVDWRTPYKCGEVCPPEEIWLDCGPACPRTCDNWMQEKIPCELECVAGCHCKPGLVKKGDKCVNISECEDCVCKGYGDPHYFGFDEKYFPFQGNCTYVLARDKQKQFEVHGINEDCHDEPQTTCTVGVIVLYKGNKVEFKLNHTVLFNKVRLDVNEDFPFNDHGIHIENPGMQFILRIPDVNLEVHYSELNYGFQIKLPSQKYYNQTEGLCGLCNYDPSDDFMHRDGYITEKPNDFAFSWLVTPDETCESHIPKCKDDEYDHFCDKIFSAEFKGCHPLVDPNLYFIPCKYDTACSTATRRSACRSLTQYARACAEVGICLDWRSDDLCPITCPPEMEYNQCGPSCSITCLNKDTWTNEDCGRAPVDGCFCPDDTIFKNGACVDPNKCIVCDDDGHALGDIWTEGDCRKCECTLTGKECNVTYCPPEPICTNGTSLYPDSVLSTDCCNVYHCKVPTPQPLNCTEGKKPNCQPWETLIPLIRADGCNEYECQKKPEVCVYESFLTVVEGIQQNRLTPIMEPHQVGVNWKEGLCTSCTCLNAYNIAVPNCNTETCPEFGSEYDLEVEPNRCCPRAVLVRCKFNNELYEIGETWKTANNDPCKLFECIEDENGLAKVNLQTTNCSDSCEANEEYVKESEALCCGECKPVKCLVDGRTYEIGQTWTSARNNCYIAECLAPSDIRERHVNCPEKIPNCVMEKIDQSGCCTVCIEEFKLIPACEPQIIEDTISYFSTFSPVHGLCHNTELIPDLTECTGFCDSHSKYSAEEETFQSYCKCCQPLEVEVKTASLTCKDGSIEEFVYHQPVNCTCNPCSEGEEIPISIKGSNYMDRDKSKGPPVS